MSTNLEYRKRIKDREKEKVGREASKLNAGEKELERERKKKGEILFVGGTTWNFVAAVRK